MKSHLKKLWTGPESGDPKPIIYLGGNSTKQRAKILAPILRYYCASYFYHKNFTDNLLPNFKGFPVRAFLDSGAYSYHLQTLKSKRQQSLSRKDAEVIIDKYVDWVYEVDFRFDFIVTFDYLPDAAITEWATKRIEKRGLRPVPVYHMASPINVLRRLIDDGYTLICIGGLHTRNPKKLRPFLDQVFNFTEKHGTRCHGLGIGSSDMLNYPWFSVDSTTWLVTGYCGAVLKPSLDPRRPYVKVNVSHRTSPAHLRAQAKDNIMVRLEQNIHFWNNFMDQHRPQPKLREPLF
jgi:hypothetical protein